MSGTAHNYRWRVVSLLKLSVVAAVLLTTWILLGRLPGWPAAVLTVAGLSLFLGPFVLLTECRTPPSWRGTEHPQTDLSGVLIVCGTFLLLPGFAMAVFLVFLLAFGGLYDLPSGWIRALAVIVSSWLLVGAGIKLAHVRNAVFRQRIAAEDFKPDAT